MHLIKQTRGASKMKPGCTYEAASKPAQSSSRAEEQSASQAPPTPLDISQGRPCISHSQCIQEAKY